MALDTLQFVDSISSSATVRLNLNDGTTWGIGPDGFDFSPPPLRRAINGTLLADGSVQSQSSYDNRTLSGVLELSASSIDACASEMQKLHRELDREFNYLKWQPNGATSPVFFRTLRTPPDNVAEVSASGAYKKITVAILAEPFALGLREDVSVGAVNNDPAAASNGLFFDVSNVKGDVATPAFIQNANGLFAMGFVASRQRGTPSDLVFFGQCESMTFGTDTAGGGSTDAVMSGSANPNFARTSFSTTTAMTTRLSWTPASTVAQGTAYVGAYRVFAVVRRSDNTSVIQLTRTATPPFDAGDVSDGTTVTVPKETGRQIIDLGLHDAGSYLRKPGKFGSDARWSDTLNFKAARVSGTGTLDWDYILLLPADEQMLIWDTGLALTGSNGNLDGLTEAVYCSNSAALTGAIVGPVTGVQVAGGFPALLPGQTNRIFYVIGNSSVSANGEILHSKSTVGAITVYYWPHYLYVRPAST